ncbi:MAG TPA: diguanylate cyclase [Nitrospiraceae bacterium]|nr:diguanylate cyclase [Nitrospiraceae bacterium]
MKLNNVVQPTVMVKAAGPQMQTVLEQRLGEAGYTVRPVNTSREVLEDLDRQQRVEALVWTIEESETEAMHLLQQLQDRESDMCVIFMGPELGAERVSECLRNGAFDYLAMPVRPGRMEESLRQGLDIRHSFHKVQGLSGQLSVVNEELSRERDRLKRLNHSLVLLNQLGQAMSATHEADEIVRIVAERVSAILPYDVLSVRWREPKRVWKYLTDTMNPGSVRLTSDETLRQDRTSSADSSIVDGIEVPLLFRMEEIGVFGVERVQGQPFGAADRELMMTIGTSLALSLTNAEAHRTLEQMAMKDGLTDLFNRRAFDQLLSQEVKAAERYRSPICLLLGDVDHFKAVNDRFGHPVGDALLKELAALLTASLREVDRVARYGGEEFAMILPRTDVASGTVLANRIREQIERHVFMIEGVPIRLTLSLGVAGYASGSIRTTEELVNAADQALYQAKTHGRNRVEVQAETAPRPRARRAYARS